MGMLYAWATPEHLLWEMTLGQVILLHNKAIEIRTPTDPDKPKTTLKTADDVLRVREQLREQYGAIADEGENNG